LNTAKEQLTYKMLYRYVHSVRTDDKPSNASFFEPVSPTTNECQKSVNGQKAVGDAQYQNPLPNRQIHLPGGKSKASLWRTAEHHIKLTDPIPICSACMNDMP